MKPIPKIIELARKLYAAGYRQEIQKGDWYVFIDEIVLWPEDVSRQETTINRRGWPMPPLSDCTPIPTLTHCLDWLRERVGYFSLQPYFREREPGFEPIVGWKIYIQHNPLSWKTYGDTPLEAAMLAMIKILEASDERT